MKKVFVFLAAVFFVSSCQSTLDCLGDDQPEWQQKTLDTGVRFQQYNESVSLIQDNADFSIQEFRTSGLPDGINCTFNGMTAQFSGMPIALGTYTVTLKAEIGYYNSDETAISCSKTVSGKYTLAIQ